jgi:hypothetical protein
MLYEELYSDPSYTGTGMLRDAADGSKEYKNPSTNEWATLDPNSVRTFRALYPTRSTEITQMLISDNTINGYY